jgi:hypothetical protein
MLSLKPLTAQIAYYTAKALSDSFVVRKNGSFEFKADDASKVRICGLLKDFLPDARTDKTVNAGIILSKYLNNPFLGIQANKIKKSGSAGDNAVPSLESFSPGGALGISVTNFADGLAKFLVKRFKEELSVTFFQKFKSTIDKSLEMQTLFPHTYKVLLALDADVYQFSSYLNTLREAFIQDLSNFYLHIKEFSNLKEYRLYFKQHPLLLTCLEGSFYLVDQYGSGRHPGEALEHFDTSMLNFRDPAVQQNVRSTISVVEAVSGSFRSVSPQHYWVPADSLRMLLEDNVSRDLYFGLICQKYGDITFSKSSGAQKRFDTLLAQARYAGDQSVQKYRNYVQSISSRADEISEYVSGLKAKNKTDIDFNDYYKLYNSSLDLVGQAFDFLKLPAIDSLLDKRLKHKIDSTSAKILFVAHSTAEVYIDIRTRNYSSAILNAANIIDTLLVYHYDRFYVDSLTGRGNLLNDKLQNLLGKAAAKRKVKKIIKDFSDIPALSSQSLSLRLKQEKIPASVTVYFDSLITTSRLLTKTIGERKLTHDILKYGTFAASVAQAQNSDQVEQAIESVALPSGSSRIKRETSKNISLNGYLGGFGGWEYLPALKRNPTSFSAGLSAPVGIGYSFGRIGKGRYGLKGGKSLTIFLPVIDVGALAAFRFANDSSKVASDVQFKNILAPGLFLYLGLGKCPISIGAGVQLGPQLREISAKNPADVNLDKNFYVRYGLSAAVDIPFLNLFSKNKE